MLKKNIAISESGFIFNPTTGDTYSVNEIGYEIMCGVRDEKTPEEITEEVVLKYDVDADNFERYYLDFISDLRKEGFLE